MRKNHGMTREDLPLVTVGMPIRNAGSTIVGAIASIVSQTYTNLEIIIADNASTDTTPDFCELLRTQDQRIRYIRHSTPIPAWKNFAFLVNEANGEYFLWAAHDDRRAVNYIEVLLRGLRNRPEASLTFSDLDIFSRYEEIKNEVVPYLFDSTGLSERQRIHRYPKSACAEIYGLHRTQLLKDYDWKHIDFAPDLPFLVYLSLRGDFVYEAGTKFFQWKPEIPKTPNSRAKTDSFGNVRPLRVLRLGIRIAAAASLATSIKGRKPRPPLYFVWSYFPLRISLWKTWLFERSPRIAQRAWKVIKYRHRSLNV